jgi:hypothetical protein
MVKSVVLLAPGGLIRESHFTLMTRFMYSGWVPTGLLEWVVRKRLGGNKMEQPVVELGDAEKTKAGDETKGKQDPKFTDTVISHTQPDVTIGDVTEWQLRNHNGFVKSFISSMRYGSIRGQQETWKKLGARPDKVLIVAGSEDSVIDAGELGEDALEAIGESNVEWRVVECGHEFPVSRGKEVVEIIGDFWGL